MTTSRIAKSKQCYVLLKAMSFSHGLAGVFRITRTYYLVETREIQVMRFVNGLIDT